MNDHDIASIVRSAKLEPRPGELEQIRQGLVDAAAGIRSTNDDHDRAARSWVRSAALVAAVVAFLTVAVGVMMSWRGDTGAPANRPDPTSAPTPTTPRSGTATTTTASAAAPPALDGVTGTWLLAAVDGTAWSGPSVPLVRVEGAELLGWDGCNGGSWPSATADSLGPASTTLVQCATEVPGIFGATTLTLDDDGSSLQLGGPTGEFEFVPLEAGIVPTLDDLVGPWKLGDTTVEVSIDPADDRLVFGVGTCGFALETDGTVLSPVAGPESPASCVELDAAGFATALADTERELAAVVIDDVLYLTVGQDALAPSEAYALARASGEVPSGSILDAVTLERGEVFGLGPDWSGEAGPPDQTADGTLAVIGASLGPVGVDTGWYELELIDVGGDPQCLAGAEYRVLWWGDLSVAFRRLDGIELLWAWSVGDRRASGLGDRGEPTVDDTGAPTGLVTEAGIGVGSTVEELLAAFPDRLVEIDVVGADGAVRYISAGGQWPGLTNSSIGFTVRDGLVTGYATTLSLC